MENRSPPIHNRIISLILAILVFPSLLAVPALADSSGTVTWVNLLDYGYPEGYSSNYIDLTSLPSKQTILYYTEPGASYIYYMDVVFRTDDTNFKIGSLKEWFQVVSLGDGVYRAFGKMEAPRGRVPLYFNSSDGTFLEVLRLNVSYLDFASYYVNASGSFSTYGNSTPVQTINYTGNGSPGNYASIDASSGEVQFVTNIEIPGWKRFDYLQITVDGFISNLSSIRASLNGVELPFSINYVNTSTRTGLELVVATLVIDCREVDYSLQSSNVVVEVSGKVVTPYNGSFRIQDVRGFLEVEPPSPLVFWFDQLNSWITAQTNAIGIYFGNVGTWFSNLTSAIGGFFTTQTETISTFFMERFSNLGTTLSNLHYALRSQLDEWYQFFYTTFLGWHNGVLDAIDSAVDRIVEAISPQGNTDGFREDVENIRDQMQDANNAMGELERPSVDDVFSDVNLDIGSGTPFFQIMGSLFENDFVVSIVTGSLAFSIFGLLVG